MIDAGPRSTCFFLTRQDDPHDGYPERYRPALAAALDATAAAGFEIGLHASYRARERPGAIAQEAAPLDHPQGLRHHYLRSDPDRLAAELRQAGLRYDSSIGWASLPGLRAGTPYPYRLWDPERREPGGWELPLALMDATLAEERYLGLDADAAFDAAVATLEPVAEHGGAVAILWHPPSHHPRLSQGLRPALHAAARVDRGAGRPRRHRPETLDRWEAGGLQASSSSLSSATRRSSSRPVSRWAAAGRPSGSRSSSIGAFRKPDGLAACAWRIRISARSTRSFGSGGPGSVSRSATKSGSVNVCSMCASASTTAASTCLRSKPSTRSNAAQVGVR